MAEKKKSRKEDNLKKNSDRTPTERKELARKAGIASGERRREKAHLRKLVEAFGELKAPEQIKKVMRGMGVEDERCTNDMAIVVGLYQKAIKGSVFAFNAIRDITGEKPIEKTDVSGKIENKIEIGFVGSDFEPVNDESEVDL